MKTFRTIRELREHLAGLRSEGTSIGLVPTMGALHEGHLSLIRRARQACGTVVVSLFVNPVQFGPGEDYQNYPRSEAGDLAACEREGVGAVFAPAVEEMYPQPPKTSVHVAGLGEGLCGASRPGHFDGVCTVVSKLLNIVEPQAAFFGRKDYQQARIVQRMVEDLNFPVRIELCPTVREADGLAMSSRNRYLDAESRRQAPGLYAALMRAGDEIRPDGPPRDALLETLSGQIAHLVPAGQIDYLELADPQTLEPLEVARPPALLALAVRLGGARLIDNIVVDEGGAVL
jgi:pantoate--beta-alanine ligase